MPLFARKSEAGATEPEAPTSAESELRKKRESLLDEGLLASWFMQYRLEQEVDRALRHGRPLAILMAQPELIIGERLTRAARTAAAGAAIAAGRTTDLVGWAEDNACILIVMPETDPELARVGATRLRDEIWRRGRAVNAPQWDITLMHDPDAFRSPLPLASAAVERIAPAA